MKKEFLISGILVLTAIGCGGTSEKYALVTGMVSMNGEPLSGVNVMFEPLAEGKGDPPGKFSVGKTDENGQFKLASPQAKVEGAAIGRHRVRILTPNIRKYTDKQKQDARNKLLAQAKADGIASPEISDDRVQVYLEDTLPDNFVEPIPPRYNMETTLSFEVTEKGPNDAKFEIQSK